MFIKIGEPVAVPVHRNMFEVVMEHYSGDADAYHTDTVLLSVQHERQIIDEYKLQDSAYDEGFIHDCIRDWSEENRKVYFDGILPWPSDAFSDGECAAQLDNMTIFFYDADGTKHACELQEIQNVG